MEQARNLDIASSLETQPEFGFATGSRQKRLFGFLRPSHGTIFITTDFNSTVIAQTDSTSTETRFQKLGCLPAGMVVCK
jgi:hypothetical protein